MDWKGLLILGWILTSCLHRAAFHSRNDWVTFQWLPTWMCSMYMQCASIQLSRMHTKANSSSGMLIQTYTVASKKVHIAPFFKHSTFSFFFSYYFYVFVFHSRNSGDFAVSIKLLGLAWCLHNGECHSVSYHKDLQEGRATNNVQWHVGSWRTDQFHRVVSAF